MLLLGVAPVCSSCTHTLLLVVVDLQLEKPATGARNLSVGVYIENH